MPVQPMAKKVPCECRIATRFTPAVTCEECKRRETYEWHWDKADSGATVVFHNNDRDVIFNPGFSVGTAAVRGVRPFKSGYHHFWEIEMSTEVYGTDMMIGIGTDKTDLRKYSHNFVSLLGLDEQSWGLSYSGETKHAGHSQKYSRPFGQNSIIGVHLDLWAGTLEFYLDRKPLGKAFSGLRDKTLYPMLSSTAARSGMNLIFCRSYPASLQLHIMLSLSQNWCSTGNEDENSSIFKCLPLPPGMKVWMRHNYWWIVSCRDRERKREEDLNNRAKSDKERSRARRRMNIQNESILDEALDLFARAVGSTIHNEVDDRLVVIHNDEDDDEDDVDEEEEDGGNDEGDEEEVAGPSNTNTPLAEPPPTKSPKRRAEGSQQQCTRSMNEEDGSASGGTSCMRLLAASSSGAQFLGRVSPIFVGLPEGGFSILSRLQGDPIVVGSNSPIHSTSSVIVNRPTMRSRSLPAQPSTSAAAALSGSVLRTTREASSSEDEDSSGTSARREPKRLRLRTSIDDTKRAEEDDQKL